MLIFIEDEIFFRKILKLKKEYYLSKKAFHKLTGIHPPMQDRMEKGGQVIFDYGCLDRICRVFGENKRDLLMGLCREEVEGMQAVCLVHRSGCEYMSGYDPLWEMSHGLARTERFTVQRREDVKIPQV